MNISDEIKQLEKELKLKLTKKQYLKMKIVLPIIMLIIWMYALSYYIVEIIIEEYKFSDTMWIDAPTQLLVGIAVMLTGTIILSKIKL